MMVEWFYVYLKPPRKKRGKNKSPDFGNAIKKGVPSLWAVRLYIYPNECYTANIGSYFYRSYCYISHSNLAVQSNYCCNKMWQLRDPVNTILHCQRPCLFMLTNKHSDNCCKILLHTWINLALIWKSNPWPNL